MRPRARAGLAGAALAACLGLGGPARGQAPSPQDRALATELFERGRALLAGGSVPEACRALEASQRLDPGLGTLLNLAVCHRREGRTATAFAEFTEALALAERQGHADRVALAEQHLGELRPRLSRLRVEVPAGLRPALGATPSAGEVLVLRDETPLPAAAWGVATPVDPGEHRVVALFADGTRRELVVTVPEGGAETVTLTAPTAPPTTLAPATPRHGRAQGGAPPRAPPTPPPSHHGDGARLGPWLTLGGVLALGVGGGATWVALDRDAQAAARCRPACTPRAATLSTQAGSAADVATVAFTAGVVAVGVGLWLWLSSDAPPPATAAWEPALRF